MDQASLHLLGRQAVSRQVNIHAVSHCGERHGDKQNQAEAQSMQGCQGSLAEKGRLQCRQEAGREPGRLGCEEGVRWTEGPVQRPGGRSVLGRRLEQVATGAEAGEGAGRLSRAGDELGFLRDTEAAAWPIVALCLFSGDSEDGDHNRPPSARGAPPACG